MKNEDALQKVKTKRKNTIRERQWRFVGHILREEDGTEKQCIETEMKRNRARGRQRMKMLDWMKEKLKVKTNAELGDIAKERKKWEKGWDKV